MLIHKHLVQAVVPLILLITLAVWYAACTNPFYPVGPGGGSSSSGGSSGGSGDDSGDDSDSGDGSDTWLIDGLLVPERAWLYKKEGSPIAWRSVTDLDIHPNTNAYLEDVCDYLDDMGHAGEYLMLLGADITSPAVEMSTSFESRKLTIAGVGDTPKTIQLDSAVVDSSLVTIEGGNTLVLHRNITLQGLSDGSTAALVTVSSGTLVMEEGSAITGHTSISIGGGVFVNGGSFIMNGGSIHDNTANNGGGVSIRASGSFIKQRGGGVIEDNTATDTGHQAFMEHMEDGALSYHWRNNNVSADESLNTWYPNLGGGWDQ